MKNSALNVYILLDRSGSMAPLWSESIGAINNYVKELDKNTNVLLATFCSDYKPGSQFGGTSYKYATGREFCKYEVVRMQTAGSWDPISYSEISPGGGTPLYEAATKLFTRMFEDNANRSILVVMTDGYENVSAPEYTSASVKELVSKAKMKDWAVVFLGANFDKVDESGQSFGVTKSSTLNLTPGKMDVTFNNVILRGTRAYVAGNSALSAYNFSDADRKLSGEAA